MKAKDFSAAQSFALNAYLQGIELLEPKMKANLPGYVEQIEALMSSFRSSISSKDSLQLIEAKKLETFGKLKEARIQFSTAKMSPGVAFGAAFSIFLREGFEAVLIIIILLTILRAMNRPEAASGFTRIGSRRLVWVLLLGVLLQMSG